ncbi:MAG: histidinol dehydrogenase, partial [Muribaculaceae bacterium]|nr:histidinol dehydrogenase [Muribaculaceae bacterium]
MDIVINPQRSQWKALTERNIHDDPQVTQAVEAIIVDVRQRGDEALRDMAAKFDHAVIDGLEVSEAEIDEACALVPDNVKEAIRAGAANIRRFHQAQMPDPVKVETM